jgi:Uma2 family endonuclease
MATHGAQIDERPTLGPEDEGLYVTAEEFASAVCEAPWAYERDDGRLVLLLPNTSRRSELIEEWRNALSAYWRRSPRVIERISSNHWVRIDANTDRACDLAVYRCADGSRDDHPGRPPDVVFDVVSPSRVLRGRDDDARRSDFLRVGVREYVAIDQDQSRLVISRPSPRGEQIESLGPGDTYQSDLLPGLSLHLTTASGEGRSAETIATFLDDPHADAHRLSLGPKDDGLLLSADDFASAELLEPWHYERVDGRLVVMSPEGRRHVRGTREWRRRLSAYWNEHPDIIEDFLPSPWIRVDGGTDRIGDFAVYLVREGPAPEPPDRAPDILFEFVSPGRRSKERDYVHKRDDYYKAGVREYVIIDRIARQVTVLTHAPEGYRERVLDASEIYETPLLPGFVIPLAEAFG